MADWRKLAKAALLADGTIDAKEVKIIRKELFADGKIDKSEVEFLAEVRNAAKSTVPGFKKLFAEAVTSNVLADGAISPAEAKWLRKAIFADKKVDADEVKLLKALKAAATATCPEFEQLYKECVK